MLSGVKGIKVDFVENISPKLSFNDKVWWYLISSFISTSPPFSSLRTSLFSILSSTFVKKFVADGVSAAVSAPYPPSLFVVAVAVV